VTFIQRFGSGANLNVHLHVLVLEGVFTELPDGKLVFHHAPRPTTPEVSELLMTARKRILRHLGQCGLLDDDHGKLIVDACRADRRDDQLEADHP
jgi:hypothetical protein